MAARNDRTPINVKRGKGGTGGDHTLTRSGVMAHIESLEYQISKHKEKQIEWHVKHARAEQHQRGVARHPEFSGMTPLQLARAIADFEGNFWVEEHNVLTLKMEVEVLQRLLKR